MSNRNRSSLRLDRRDRRTRQKGPDFVITDVHDPTLKTVTEEPHQIVGRASSSPRIEIEAPNPHGDRSPITLLPHRKRPGIERMEPGSTTTEHPPEVIELTTRTVTGSKLFKRRSESCLCLLAGQGVAREARRDTAPGSSSLTRSEPSQACEEQPP